MTLSSSYFFRPLSSAPMASSALLKFHSQTFKPPNPSSNHPKSRIISHLHFPNSNSRHSRRINKESATRTRFLVPLCSSSLPSPSSPPTSKEEAILQAKTCLSSCLVKPLNNPKLASPKLKRLKQPRFRLEIPILDDDGSPSSLTQLAFSIFNDMPISRRGSDVVKLLFLWPDTSFIEPAVNAFRSDSTTTNHVAMSPVSDSLNRALKSADVAVFMAPERSQLEDVRVSTEGFATKPVVMINPRWLFEDEKSFGDDDFVGSFDVIYAFTGLEVRGILSKRKGVIFKCVRDGVVSGERWNVLVEEEEGDGALKVVSRFKARPSMEEVELVLYNLMAMNSPITKSAKFLKDLVSNITGKK